MRYHGLGEEGGGETATGINSNSRDGGGGISSSIPHAAMDDQNKLGVGRYICEAEKIRAMQEEDTERCKNKPMLVIHHSSLERFNARRQYPTLNS